MDSQPEGAATSHHHISEVVLDVAREVGVGVNLTLHPLPILNIADHLTRTRVQKQSDNVKVYGVLLGSQNGRDIDVQNSFEMAVRTSSAPDAPSTQLEVDHVFLQARQAQYKLVFPSLDFLGWYAVGLLPSAEDMHVHQQLLQYNEAPLFLQFSPTNARMAEATASGDLPLSIYESIVEIVKGETRHFFVPAGYRIETGEAERIAVDHVSKQSAPGAENDGAGTLLSNLETSSHAIHMLSDRIKAVRDYVASIHARLPEGKTVAALAAEERQAGKESTLDQETLRQVAALCASLAPAKEAQELNEELINDYHDVLLTNQLSALTKGADSLNELVDKFDFAHQQERREGPPPFGQRGIRR